jgi:hypothetical protein
MLEILGALPCLLGWLVLGLLTGTIVYWLGGIILWKWVEDDVNNRINERIGKYLTREEFRSFYDQCLQKAKKKK